MFDTAAYLDRIGYSGPAPPTVTTLRALHHAHLRTVPFENLDIHLGRPIILDETLLFAKIVTRRRGGFCYELNGLFAALLRDLGFRVTMLAARMPRDDERIALEMDHLVLLVRAADDAESWLVDVGAGRDSFSEPLRTTTAAEQPRPASGASFRLVPGRDGCQLQRRDQDQSVWHASYRFTWTPRVLPDFEDGCQFHQTSPDSNFPRQRLCTLLTPSGRVTLSERRLIETIDGKRTEQELEDETMYLETLRRRFGIDLAE